MINPYAQTFMIATRMDYVARPRILAARDPETGKRFRLFRRSARGESGDL